MNKPIAVFGCILSLFASHAALAAGLITISPPCLSGICIGQPFSEIANRTWVTDDGNHQVPMSKDRLKLLPIKEPVRTELNEPKVATLGSMSANIHSLKGVELIQKAQFCGGYWFELQTADEHGWPMTVIVIPLADPDGQVTLRVYALQKTLNQPQITNEQSAQRRRNFNAQFAAYEENVTPYVVSIGDGPSTFVRLSFNKDIAMMLDAQNDYVRRHSGCEQASTGF